mgnify:FL=1
MQLIPAHYVNCHSNTVVPLWRSGNLSVVGSGSVLGLICGFECWVDVGSKSCVAVNIQQAGHAAFHGIQPCILHTQCSARIVTELFWTLHTTFGWHILSGCMPQSGRLCRILLCCLQVIKGRDLWIHASCCGGMCVAASCAQVFVLLGCSYEACVQVAAALHALLLVWYSQPVLHALAVASV